MTQISNSRLWYLGLLSRVNTRRAKEDREMKEASKHRIERESKEKERVEREGKRI